VSGIFKSYDIRGLYPREIDESLVERIGVAIVHTLKAKSVVIGRDARASSPSLFHALAKGITDAGAQVYDIGVVSTPMLYFASAKLPVDAGVMITASHNPPKYNGIKVCKKFAVPVGLTSGLEVIENFTKGEQPPPAPKAGSIRPTDIRTAYFSFLRSFVHSGGRRFRIAIDTGNAMGTKEIPFFHEQKNITVTGELYTDAGAPCPHEANPLKTETLIELQHLVRTARADMGIAYDGDADRIGFVDELGHVIPMDLVLALLSKITLMKYPKATILYDLRSTSSVREIVEESGGTAIETVVGHANIKRHMKKTGAMLAGELAGHYYFNEGGYIAEMGSLPAILLMNLMAETGKKLSELVQDVRRYHHSGELNFTTHEAPKLFATLKEQYRTGILSEADGVKISFPDWWFSIRSSNTEPLVRLNLEAHTKGDMEIHKQELLRTIHQFC